MRKLAAQVPILQDKLAYAKQHAEVPRTPSMIHYQQLLSKVSLLEHKLQSRESELSHLVARTRESSRMEISKLERQHERAIAKKNGEIDRFRKQLDEILTDLEEMGQS